jgi:hypothetical protein
LDEKEATAIRDMDVVLLANIIAASGSARTK